MKTPQVRADESYHPWPLRFQKTMPDAEGTLKVEFIGVNAAMPIYIYVTASRARDNGLDLTLMWRMADGQTREMAFWHWSPDELAFQADAAYPPYDKVPPAFRKAR